MLIKRAQGTAMSMLRIRNDFRFAIISLFGVVAVVAILPFAIYRFANGQVLAGCVDIGIMLAIVSSVIYVWRGGNLDHTALVLVVICSAGCVLIGSMVGTAGVMWMYVVVVSNFLLVERKPALLVSAVAILALVLDGHAFGSQIERFGFLASSAVVSLFAFIFALRMETQKDQLETLALCDPLTGVLNRRAMEQEMRMVIEAHRRLGTTYGLMMLDLDRFKSINDTQGHEAGDAVLVNFAALVQSGIRKLDRMYRIGGEEFVLILPGSNIQGLATICENVRARVEAGLRSQDKSITVSIGAAELKDDENSADWLARADLALYRAKRGGRNRVEIDQDSEPVATARTTYA
jgi:diguanylate cyclase (GGDEF)-like protein